MDLDEVIQLFDVVDYADKHGQKFRNIRSAAYDRLVEINGELGAPEEAPQPSKKPAPITPVTVEAKPEAIKRSV